ncbi:MAG TPA: sulfur transferase domain-containing protein [Vicinamibacterales bacterium]|nr:sulfur transferase domain-containing protein [Vicinamibacterales bacterium]
MTRALLAAALVALGVAAQAQAPTTPPAPTAQKETIEGVRNYTKVDATVGCAGATDSKALANIAKAGYKAVLNLREATEAGALIDESKTAAEAAGLKYIHLPFKGSAPDPKVADEFLKIVGNTDNQPIFIHCGSANRVGSLWLIKRMLVDKWPEEQAVAEAKAIGLSSDALQKFALEYVATHKG